MSSGIIKKFNDLFCGLRKIKRPYRSSGKALTAISLFTYRSGNYLSLSLIAIEIGIKYDIGSVGILETLLRLEGHSEDLRVYKLGFRKKFIVITVKFILHIFFYTRLCDKETVLLSCLNC